MQKDPPKFALWVLSPNTKQHLQNFCSTKQNQSIKLSLFFITKRFVIFIKMRSLTKHEAASAEFLFKKAKSIYKTVIMLHYKEICNNEEPLATIAEQGQIWLLAQKLNSIPTFQRIFTVLVRNKKEINQYSFRNFEKKVVVVVVVHI